MAFRGFRIQCGTVYSGSNSTEYSNRQLDGLQSMFSIEGFTNPWDLWAHDHVQQFLTPQVGRGTTVRIQRRGGLPDLDPTLSQFCSFNGSVEMWPSKEITLFPTGALLRSPTLISMKKKLGIIG